jgi:TonB family protein
MSKGRNDIEKYLKGELTPAEMHALEKEALSDPFLAEALEGGEQLSAFDFSKDVAELNEKIIKRKSTSWEWPVRIAASLLLLAVCTFILWIALKQDPEQTLALEQNLPKHQQDSLTLLTETKPAPAVSETEKSKEESNSPLQAESKKEISSKTSPQKKQQPQKTTSENIAENRKTEQAPELSKGVMDEGKSDDKVSTRIAESPLNKKADVATIDPNKKNELRSPSATEIKLAEGYIASLDARPTIVTGRVMSAEDGTPLPDVSVVLKGTSIMTKTDAHGRYAITADSQDKTLVYSSEGLESTEVKINDIDSTYLPVKIEMTEEAQEEAAVQPSGMRDFGPTNVYTIPAHPETGNRAFKQYLEKTHKYPKEAKALKAEGTVVIEFKVDATGSLSEFKIVRGIGNGCDEELIRLILQGAKWVPTTKDGAPVSDKARVKFKFELEE